ncbi:MAG: WYL domain-containing protein [Bacteroidales bacterium]|nr:WYL domain-containing protein [Bacteroidales bacterium]MBN2862182.1 WYL domain-containing protein [Bacteroidales bacterium]
MPTNKDALIRYRVINRCLKDRKYVTRKELKAACERALDIYPIGIRTIDGDINAMRYDSSLGYNAPIRLDRTRGAYYYEDPDYSIDSIPLNEDEIESLVFAARLLDQFRNIEIFKTFTGTVQKLVDAINIYRQADEDMYRSFIEFESVYETKGTEHLEPLIDAMKNKQVLKVEHKSFTSDKSTINIIHPYQLKEYRNRWFLVGLNEKFKEIRTYGLERIVNIDIERKISFRDSGFDAENYYKNVIGVSVVNRKAVEIQVAFSEVQAQYVITQPMHHSQELVSHGKNKYVFKYFLVPNFEFYAQILGWGEEVEVLKPESVRERMAHISNRILTKYKK